MSHLHDILIGAAAGAAPTGGLVRRRRGWPANLRRAHNPSRAPHNAAYVSRVSPSARWVGDTSRGDDMGLRYFRRVKLLPGFTMNLSKSGPSLSLGVRGAHVTVGRRGVRRTVGIPGTGLFYTSRSGPSHRRAHRVARAFLKGRRLKTPAFLRAEGRCLRLHHSVGLGQRGPELLRRCARSRTGVDPGFSLMGVVCE